MKLTVEAVPTKFDTYSSYHITCECSNTSVFLDPSLWPEDIFIRWWRNPHGPPSPPSMIPGADDDTCILREDIGLDFVIFLVKNVDRVVYIFV